MPDTEFATSAIAGAERYEQWRAALSDAFGPFEVHHGQAGPFAGHVRYVRRASLQFNDLHYQGQKLERTAGNVSRLDQEFYTFGLPLAGPLAVVQQGREFQVEPGCVYLMNQSLPYQATALGADGYRSLSVSFPRSALSQRDSRIGPFYKLRVDDGSPRGAMLASYMDHLFKGLDGWSPAEAAELGERLIDLIVLFLVQPGQGHASEADSSVTMAHRQRAMAYIRQHLADPALSPQRVAQGCGLSVAYLHRIFQAGDLSVESFVFDQRLERCRELLLNPAQRHRGIAELAYQAGFAHPSHFSRLFKRRFGLSPREWRAGRQ
ncbi:MULTISPECIES: helix-turn-helix domain-containing protein [Achromobacter]|uniref:AraC family transcriptional regulator n=2 Tax=Achromobacter TaxID=222 RepID=A0A0X8P1A5_ALCXX|nr:MULTISPECIES: helix-turn-helix domain-containing protein [Achromobacter]AMG38049.1 AraC family transcriptional regulator [Achromobacter xylosoxidans]EGP46751.1 AraC family regulatory helix-turn-helix protein 40 [Achromobacter insuavis AXX-A]